MAQTISRDFPLNEITLRRYEKPYNMDKRELIRKFCLSIGLLQPGDSRDVIVDILGALHNASKKKEFMSSEVVKKEVIEIRKKYKLPLRGIASSNVRRQLKRLRDLYLVEKIKNDYRITEFENISTILDEKIEKYYLQNILKRVKEYSRVLK